MWLLEAAIRNRIEQAELAGLLPTPEQRAEYDARVVSMVAGDSSRILNISGRTANIDVKGVLTKEPSWLAALFGGGNTTYAEIDGAIAQAEADDGVDSVSLNIDSGGGTVAGLFDTLAVMEAAEKPINAVVSGMAASAAYAIASQANTIRASSKSDWLGSVGIISEHFVSENRVSIASTKAPKKAPDVTTDEGKAIVQERLDSVHDLFVEAIAQGRGVTEDKVNAKYGQGDILLAGEALKRGMIDEVGGVSPATKKSAKSSKALDDGDNMEAKMDLKELKTKHPSVYAEAVAVGSEEAIKSERDRVSAHITMGTASGDMKTALEAVKSGDEMTLALQASYMSARMDRKDSEDIAKTDEEVAAAANGANKKSGEELDEKAGANILKLAAANCGVEIGETSNV